MNNDYLLEMEQVTKQFDVKWLTSTHNSNTDKEGLYDKIEKLLELAILPEFNPLGKCDFYFDEEMRDLSAKSFGFMRLGTDNAIMIRNRIGMYKDINLENAEKELEHSRSHFLKDAEKLKPVATSNIKKKLMSIRETGWNQYGVIPAISEEYLIASNLLADIHHKVIVFEVSIDFNESPRVYFDSTEGTLSEEVFVNVHLVIVPQ